MTAIRVLLISGVLMLSSGCWMKKKPIIQVPVAPVPAAAAPSPAASVPQQQPPAPVPQPAAPVTTAPATAEPAKPSPFPPATTPVRPRPAPVTPPAASVAAPAPVPVPSLGPILTADKRKQLDAAYQSDLNQAASVLNRLKGRTLTPDQNDTVSRARAFIQQAAQYHTRDLTTAAELARRARVLTQDLASALK